MGNFLWGIHHQEFPRESQWRIHHGEFTMGNSPWIWFPGHSSWIHQFAWGKESDSPRGIPHGEFSCGEFMWIFPVNSPQVSNEQYCISAKKTIKWSILHPSFKLISVVLLLWYLLLLQEGVADAMNQFVKIPVKDSSYYKPFTNNLKSIPRENW